MADSSIQCHRCQWKLPTGRNELQGLTTCPSCYTRLSVYLFPAWGRATQVGTAAQPISDSQEAACFFHADKRAVIPCDQCGRFLCSLCDFPIGNRHYCGSCVEKSAQGTHLGELERNRKRWDIQIWYWLVLPIFVCFYLIPITSIVAIVLGIQKRNVLPSLVSRSRLWIQAGIAFGILEFIGFIIAIYSIVQNQS